MYNHDYSELPIGYLDKDGKIKLRKESGVTVEQLCDLEIGYIPKKVIDGVVVEAELLELSIMVKQ